MSYFQCRCSGKNDYFRVKSVVYMISLVVVIIKRLKAGF